MYTRVRFLCSVLLASALALCVSLHAGASDVEVDCTSVHCFQTSEFSAGGEAPDGIYVAAVPPAYEARLRLAGRTICRGDVLPASALGAMTLEPMCVGEAECVMQYCPIRAGRIGEAVTLTMRILSGRNTAPACTDGTLETYKNIANRGTLQAVDKEHDEMTYQLVRAPKRGTVELMSDGSFVYTPGKNKVGKDSFVFTATDAAGNVSNEATVKIRIVKPTDRALYTDLAADEDAFRAMWLREQDIYAGRTIAGNLCFEPDRTVSRGEFLAMAMKLLSLEGDGADVTACFADGASAPGWQQPYIAAAFRNGIVQGVGTEDGLMFRPAEELTLAEAAVMLQKMLRLPAAQAVFAPEEELAIPAWAKGAVGALESAGFRLTGGYTDALTMREAARLLYAALPAAEEARAYWSE